MQEIGAKLREARLQRGMSVEDVAHITKVPRASIEAIEEGNLALLPAPVFVRGFVRAFAQTVRLDPDELLREVPELQTQLQAPTIPERRGSQIGALGAIGKLGPAPRALDTAGFRGGQALLLLLAIGMVVAAWLMVGQRTQPASGSAQNENTPAIQDRVDGVSSYTDAHESNF